VCEEFFCLSYVCVSEFIELAGNFHNSALMTTVMMLMLLLLLMLLGERMLINFETRVVMAAVRVNKFKGKLSKKIIVMF
jgi:hypothetical protein